MRALSLSQPLASLCVLVRTWDEGKPVAEKEYETRSFGCSWARKPEPQPIYIHASKGILKWARSLYETNPHFKRVLSGHGYDKLEDLPTGVIIGSVNMQGSIATEAIRDRLSDQERAFGIYNDGRLAIRLSDPLAFNSYFRVNGNRGLWAVPEELYLRIQNA